VVSTGRTGTTFLAQVAGDLGAEGCHEPGPWWLRHLSNAYVSGHLDHDRAVRILRAQRPAIGAGAPYLEASCLIYGLVAPLLDAFPAARVIQIVRDPRTYVRSGLAWGVYRFGGRTLNLAPYRRLAPPQFHALDPMTRLRWMADDQFARLCWAWSAMNEAMRTQGAGHDRFRTVPFEDLTDPDNGPEVLGTLIEDLGLAAEPDRLAGLTAGPVNTGGANGSEDWRAWTDARLQVLRQRTAGEAAHYDYPVAAQVDAVLAAR
jgi:hypothetical protein